MNNSILSRAAFPSIFIFLMLTISILSACGGGGGSDDSKTPVVNKGVFLDSRSEGIHYKSGNQEGDTNSKGEFKYEPGKKVTFSIGTIVLGEVDGKDTVTPIDLVPGAQDETHPWVTNRTRFLLSLDEDGYPANGITINQKIREEARNHKFSFDRDEDEFENDPGVTDAVSRFTRHHKRGEHDLEDRIRAHHHLHETREHMGDNNRPSLNVSCPADPSYTSDIAIAFTSNNSTAIFSCSLDGATPEDCASPFERSGLTDGAHTFEVTATSYRGKTRTDSCSWTIDTSTADTTAPETTIDTMPDDPTSRTYADFTFSANEPASFECNLDNAGWVSCSTPLNYSNLADGTHSFEVRATDIAGNVDATPAAYSWTVDTTGPVTTIISGPDSLTNNTTASLAFTANESATFECNLDSLGWSTCTSVQAYSNLTEGEHNFLVRATDTLGQLGNEAAYTWSIDTTPPVATITSGPSNPTNATEATFTFNASESSTFECNVDSSGWETCTSPVTYNNLADTNHNFDVRAKDLVGNTGNPTSYSWVIDTTLPVPPTLNCPSSLTNSSAVTVAFSSNDSVTFECSLDSNAYSTCISPYTETGLLEGVHEVAVRAIDDVGNISPPSTCSWTIDTTPPVTTIISSPEDPTNSTGASFTFAADESSTYECSLNGSAFASCNSPQAYTGLAEGSQNFQVRATDQAGNTGTPASDSWTIDTTAPQMSSLVCPVDPTNNPDATITFDADESSTFVCNLDGSNIAGCSSPFTNNSLSEGTHNFLVTPTDLAGNEGASSSCSWDIDTTAPETSITTGPVDPTNSIDATFTFNANESSTFECSLDNADWKACVGPMSYTGLTEAPHNFQVRATDLAGNPDNTPATYDWSIDITSPVVAIDSGPEDPTNATEAAFTFSANEASTFECSLDSGTFVACSSGVAYTGLTEGDHNFQVQATDLAGNIGFATHSWKIDLTPPVTSINNCPTGVAPNNSGSFDFSSNEESTFECSLDGSALNACTNPYPYSNLANGEHTFYVEATDLAGNRDVDGTSCTWSIVTTDDTESPSPTSISINNSATYAVAVNELSVRIKGSDNVGITQYLVSEHNATVPNVPDPDYLLPTMSDPRWVDITETANLDLTIQFPLTGSYSIGDTVELCVWFIDAAGNQSSAIDPVNDRVCDTIIYGVDWESGWGNFWYASNGVWEVGGPPATGPMECYSGTLCAATILNDNYPDSVSSSLISPTIVLPTLAAGEQLQLRFWHWFQFHGSDQGIITVDEETTPGAWSTSATLANYAGHSSGTWTRTMVDLSAYAGKTVRLRFQLSNPTTYGTTTGWYFDDISIDIAQENVSSPYFDDFETGLDDWWARNGIWEVGVPTTGPAGCYSGTQCAATILNDNYPDSVSSGLISPTIVLPTLAAGEQLQLRFWHWFQFHGSDQGIITVDEETTPGAWSTSATLANYAGHSSGTWTRTMVDLSAYAGKTVRLRFQLSNPTTYGTTTGWYFDDISIDIAQENVSSPYFDDFETGLDDWWARNGIWEVGVPTTGPAGCYSGTQCAATILNDNYPDSVSSGLISPTIVLPTLAAGEQLQLRFWHWFQFHGSDQGIITVDEETTPGAWSTSATLANYAGHSSGTWTRTMVDLSAYAGKTVRLRFQLSNPTTYGTTTGWYFDDISIDIAQENVSSPYFDDFETGLDDWWARNGIWEVGVPTTGPAGCYSGTQCAATILNDNYPDSVSSGLISPTIVLPTLAAGEQLQLRFWHWFQFHGSDKGIVYVEEELSPGTWSISSEIISFTSNSGGVWSRPLIDMTSYSGKTIRVRFQLSNPTTYGIASGWYIDDVSTQVF